VRAQDKALVRLAQQACPRQLLACPAAAGAASVAPLSRRMHWRDKLYGENKLPTKLNLKYYSKRLKIKKILRESRRHWQNQFTTQAFTAWNLHGSQTFLKNTHNEILLVEHRVNWHSDKRRREK